jgi:hypothetical protein
VGSVEMSYVCFCDLPAPLKTSWTRENPGRRLWGNATYDSRVCSVMIEVLPLNNLSEFLLIDLQYFNIQTKVACRFSKWLDKPTCAKGVEVLVEMTKKVKDLDDENDRCMARIKDLENENDSCMERVKHLQKGDDKHMKIIKCLEKENEIYRAREKFFTYALLLS